MNHNTLKVINKTMNLWSHGQVLQYNIAERTCGAIGFLKTVKNHALRPPWLARFLPEYLLPL